MFFLGLGISLIVGGITGLIVGVLLFASARKNREGTGYELPKDYYENKEYLIEKEEGEG